MWVDRPRASTRSRLGCGRWQSTRDRCRGRRREVGRTRRHATSRNCRAGRGIVRARPGLRWAGSKRPAERVHPRGRVPGAVHRVPRRRYRNRARKTPAAAVLYGGDSRPSRTRSPVSPVLSRRSSTLTPASATNSVCSGCGTPCRGPIPPPRLAVPTRRDRDVSVTAGGLRAVSRAVRRSVLRARSHSTARCRPQAPCSSTRPRCSHRGPPPSRRGWVRYPSNWRPGRPRPVYLAGDYTTWSSIQSAIESGRRATRTVTDALD